jgi:hypothetical protein
VKARTPNLESVLNIDVRQNNILPLLEPKDYLQLMHVNKAEYQFFKNFPRDVVYFNKFSPCVVEHRLVHHFAFVPDEKRANAVLEHHLNLLALVFKKVVFPQHTVTNVTFLQLVHGSGDIEMRDRVLRPLFIRHYGEEKGIEEMQRQIGEMKNVHKPFDFGPIIEAISNELFNHVKDFDDNQPKIIDKAMQFRWETLQEFIDAYDSAASHWGHSDKKCALLEDVALTWMLRYAMENDKQRFNQGVYHLQKENPEPFYRAYANCDGHPFDVLLSRASNEFVLDSPCVDILFGGSTGGRRTISAPSFLAEFLLNKNSGLAEPCRSTEQRKRKHV